MSSLYLQYDTKATNRVYRQYETRRVERQAMVFADQMLLRFYCMPSGDESAGREFSTSAKFFTQLEEKVSSAPVTSHGNGMEVR